MRFSCRGHDGVRLGLRVDFNVLALIFGELCFERRWFPRGQHRVDRPVFHRDERANIQLAIHNQAQRHRLHASGGKTPAHLVPEQRRNFVADEAVQHAARLLRVHQVFVDLAGMLERRLDRFGRDFVEHHAEYVFSSDDGLALGDGFLDGLLGFLLALLAVPVRFFDRCFLFFRGKFELGSAQHFGQVGANGLAFAVRIARQIDGIGSGGSLLQLRDDARLIRIDFIRRRKPVRDIDAQHLLGQVHNVPVGSLDHVIAAQDIC